MPLGKPRKTTSTPATWLARLALIATLATIFTTVFDGSALRALTPAGAELSDGARHYSVAAHYGDKTGAYRASTANRVSLR